MFEPEDLIRMYLDGTLTDADRTRFDALVATGQISAEDIAAWQAIADAVKHRAHQHAYTLPPLPVLPLNNAYKQEQKLMDILDNKEKMRPPRTRPFQPPSLMTFVMRISVAVLLIAIVFGVWIFTQSEVVSTFTTLQVRLDDHSAVAIPSVDTQVEISVPQTAYEAILADADLTHFAQILENTATYRELLQSDEAVIVIAPNDDTLPEMLIESYINNEIWLSELIRHGEGLSTTIPNWAVPYRIIGLQNGGAVIVVSGEIPPQMIYHTVESGDTLVSIAARYEMPFANLLAINDLRPTSIIAVGQQLAVGLGSLIDTIPPGMVAVTLPIQDEIQAGLRRGQNVAIFFSLRFVDMEGTEFQELAYSGGELITDRLTANAEVGFVGDLGFMDDVIVLYITPEEADILTWMLEANVPYTMIPVTEFDVITPRGDGQDYSVLNLIVDEGDLTDIALGDVVVLQREYRGDEPRGIPAVQDVAGRVIGVNLPASVRGEGVTVNHETATRLTVLLSAEERERFMLYAESLMWPVSITTSTASDINLSAISFMTGMPGDCGVMRIEMLDTGWVSPIDPPYTLIQEFRESHPGIDFNVVTGTPVYAANTGRVIFSGWNEFGYGYMVVLSHGTSLSLYAHLEDQPVAQCGTIVNAGQRIGAAGSTGNSSGSHLHFEIRIREGQNFVPVNPLDYLPE